MIAQAFHDQYWGKARPESDAGPCWHPLARHCLDVAAVSSILLEEDPWLRATLARTSGILESTISQLVPLFVALHDPGKFTPSFQGLVPELARQLQGLPLPPPPYRYHHDTTGHLFWKKRGLAALIEEGLTISLNGTQLTRERDHWKVLVPWIRAVTGHHGTPPKRVILDQALETHFTEKSVSDAVAFTKALTRLFPVRSISLSGQHSKSGFLSTSAWLLAGLTVLSDWLGSNQTYFPYNTDRLSLEDYWIKARSQAASALRDNGLLPVVAAAERPILEIFPYLSPPTPLQSLATTVSIGEGPQLFLIEEVTGGGKTEGAVHLAHRLMAGGRADGVFFALPTMATANAMRERIGSIYTKLYAPDTTPSFILAHSASDLARALQPKPSPIPMATLEAPGEDLSYGAQHTAGQQCAAWLQDNRKKALLAQVGVGTLDQVLLGVLPSRHAPLRLVGLARKVLIVDEVHAYDPYMHALLQQVLKFHATFGGSAILLSATLPAQMRAQLIAAFRGGAGDSSAEPPVLQEDYPLLTRVDTTQVEQRPLACRAGAARAVAVRFVDSSAAALDTLTAVVRAGGCAVWIRNTVGDALEALEQAEASGLSPEQLTLFHARFTLGDRLAIEEDVLARFGKRSTPESRAGRLVIATQVVEQSLDLDFDFMVSDLAPIDLLIQRAGRLHRHARAERPAIARAPVLGVLAPPWAGEPGDRWVQDVLPGTGAVYQHHGQLWLTMYALLQRGRLATPDDSRALVETVYGELVDVPEGLLGRTWEAEGEALAQQGTADLNKLELLSGYEHKGAWLSETRTPTRLGEQQATWQLGYQDGAHVVPLWGQAGAPPWLRWRLSQVQLRHKLFAERTGPLAAIAEQSEPEHQPKWIRRLLLTATDEGVWVGQGQDHKEKPIEVLYDRRRGLRVQKGSHE